MFTNLNINMWEQDTPQKWKCIHIIWHNLKFVYATFNKFAPCKIIYIDPIWNTFIKSSIQKC